MTFLSVGDRSCHCPLVCCPCNGQFHWSSPATRISWQYHLDLLLLVCIGCLIFLWNPVSPLISQCPVTKLFCLIYQFTLSWAYGSFMGTFLVQNKRKEKKEISHYLGTYLQLWTFAKLEIRLVQHERVWQAAARGASLFSYISLWKIVFSGVRHHLNTLSFLVSVQGWEGYGIEIVILPLLELRNGICFSFLEQSPILCQT